MTYLYIKAAPGDAGVLAPLNKRLIDDEGHRNPMGVEALRDRMRGWLDRKSTRLNSSHPSKSRMPSSA